MSAPANHKVGLGPDGGLRLARWAAVSVSVLAVSSLGAGGEAWAQAKPADDSARAKAEVVTPKPEAAADAPPAAPTAASTAVTLPPQPATSSARTNAARRGPPVWRLEIVAPKPLDELLRNYLDLSRFQSQAQAAASADADDGPDEAPAPAAALVTTSTTGSPLHAPTSSAAPTAGASRSLSRPASSTSTSSTATVTATTPALPNTAQPTRSLGDTSVISRSELRRLVAAAPDQARSLIEAEGYFTADIKVSLSEEVPGQPMVARLEVIPGPKASVSQVQMVFEGTLDERVSKGDPDALALAARLDKDWALPKGASFRQAQWSAAKNGALATLRAEGYPAAVWSGTAATVDATAQTARLYVVADSGPAFSYGPMRVEGLNHQPESAVLNVADFAPGEPYRESELLDFQERIQKLNLFESVFVSIDDNPAVAAATPVTVQVRELPLQQATLGVGVSSDTGPRISVEHLHRLLWGKPWQAKSIVQLGRDESRVQTDLTSHPTPGRKRWLTSVLFAREIDDDDAVTLSQRFRFGQLDEDDKIERTTYVEYQRAKVSSKQGEMLSDATALTGMRQYLWRDIDSQVLPTRGLTANVAVGPGYSFSKSEDNGVFGRAYGRLTWYKPLPGRWYATLRSEAGAVVAADKVGIPDTLLFRAGGDESVRGYGYRTLGVEQSGVTLGGRALVTGSVEVARPIVAKLPELWGAVFLDVGDAAARWSDISLKTGYGVGVRYRSPVGPLRLDLAYGQDVKEFRVHFSVGIAL